MRKTRPLSLISLVFCFFFLISSSALAQQEVDVLIIGGGAGGTAAGIQAARMGTSVLILEETPWLGGMLTSAGVSAIDGNHLMPSGIWGEFRQALYDHYGGAKAVATGWVSHTLFEPSTGNRILKQMADLPNLKKAYGAIYTSIQQIPGGWQVEWEQNGAQNATKTKILIDGTETGDLLPLVGAGFRLGMDSKQDTGEAEAPESANNIVQDLTYVAILEDVVTARGRKGKVRKPKGYDAAAFDCCCKREGGEMFGAVSDCEQMLNYGKLPNGKYMINWPNCGNDYYLNWPELSKEERLDRLEEAKRHTLGFVYYIQQELGFKNLRLADEFPTKDNMPFIAYDREARRMKGKVFLTADHLESPFNFNYYKTGIAVGDYPIDHHHDKNPEAPEIDFINIKVPSYNIPMGSLVPETTPNFLVAEKNISVSNIVNGTTRLQPVVLGIGQAAGALAATAVLEGQSPEEVSIRKVQQSLLQAKAYIMPYIDTAPDDPAFEAMQRIGASGVLKGIGIPYLWANQTWFYPERIVSEFEWHQGMLPYAPKLKGLPASGKGITAEFIGKALTKMGMEYNSETLMRIWQESNLKGEFHEQRELNRREVSLITDLICKPFEYELDFNGDLKSP
ncbi:FAD-dependent oxidoreductase [Poritiphilus flavus]|uniref:FAD-dependent oxidoreductase n=1 Tax=Poritiphilus flavus TaxID=2697053 RepID=A0A6L9E9V8_9FLAO|nr:FAD-dependent oxidoreductase [Poritiphilus flavus]NAS11535.1 FAD-dependent oxidoreductase [Poritiphilus flavus]